MSSVDQSSASTKRPAAVDVAPVLSVDQIAAGVRRLPLSHTNLVALLASMGCYADTLKAEGGLTGMEPVCEGLLDAFQATDHVYAVTREQRSEWARAAA